MKQYLKAALAGLKSAVAEFIYRLQSWMSPNKSRLNLLIKYSKVVFAKATVWVKRQDEKDASDNTFATCVVDITNNITKAIEYWGIISKKNTEYLSDFFANHLTNHKKYIEFATDIYNRLNPENDTFIRKEELKNDILAYTKNSRNQYEINSLLKTTEENLYLEQIELLLEELLYACDDSGELPWEKFIRDIVFILGGVAGIICNLAGKIIGGLLIIAGCYYLWKDYNSKSRSLVRYKVHKKYIEDISNRKAWFEDIYSQSEKLKIKLKEIADTTKTEATNKVDWKNFDLSTFKGFDE